MQYSTISAAFLRTVFSFFILTSASYAQRSKADSLLIVTESFKNTIKPYDTTVIKYLNGLGVSYRKNSVLDTASTLTQRAYEMSELLLNSSGDGEVKRIAKSQLASAHNNLGNIAGDNSKYAEALQHFLSALKIREEQNDEYGKAVALNNAALIFSGMENHKEALRYLNEAAALNKKIGNTSFLSKNYNNIGNIWFDNNDLDKAREFYEKSLQLKLQLNDQKGIAMAYNNLGNVEELQNDLQVADSLYLKALRIQRQQKNTRGVATSLINLANLRQKQKRHAEEEKFLKEAFVLCSEINDEVLLKSFYVTRAALDSAQGNFVSAFEHLKMYYKVRDKLKSEESGKKVVQMQMQYEFDKKETLQRAEQEKKDAISQQKLTVERNTRNYLAGGLFLMVLLVALVYKSYRDKKRGNRELEIKNGIIEQKQKEILDSIHYARRIQRAQLPSEKYVEKSLHRLLER